MDEDWKLLASLIRQKQCTPFVGAGASSPPLPTGRELAQRLADLYRYPCQDRENLTRVAQWALTQAPELALKGSVSAWLTASGTPAFGDLEEPYSLLVDLELPVYITTNYDGFLMKAFTHKLRNAHQEICPWDQARRRNRNLGYARGYHPTPENPLIFHLHGTLKHPLTMVLTEDDYLDFLIYVQDLLPASVEAAFSDAALLFLGYGLNDPTFKVLFRKLASYSRGGRATHFAVQIDPTKTGPPMPEQERELQYLKAQYEMQRIKVFWGSCREFAAKLRPYL